MKPSTGADAWSEFLYLKATAPNSLAHVDVRHRANGSKTGTILRELQAYFDHAGRLNQEKQLLPGDVWSTTTTVYNSMGWVHKVSEADSGVPANYTKFLTFDPFGRPRKIRPPDGASHDIDLAYKGIRKVVRTTRVGTGFSGGAVIESLATSKQIYDRQGRLRQVMEPSGAADAEVTTTYGYDAGNRLASVSMGSGAQSQNRFFVYDGRGFLQEETHPEKGSVGQGTIYYYDYDAAGNFGRRRVGPWDGKFDLKLVFDRAQRIVDVKEAKAGGRLLKHFEYGSSQATSDRSNGKLKLARRYNYVPNPISGGEASVVVTENYTYGGRGGRVSARGTTIGDILGSVTHSFSQGWSYDDLGAVADLDYPTCTFTECDESPGDGVQDDPAPPRVLSHGYSKGFLTGVPGFVDSISYHPNGMSDTVTFATVGPPAVTFRWGPDPNGMLRPGFMEISGHHAPSPVLTGSLDYQYDGFGNIVRFASETYSYDLVSRIKRGVLGTGDEQSYSYDAFGNILNIASVFGGVPVPQSFSIVPGTNRISGVPYDEEGNQLSWNQHSYGYDSLSMMNSLTGADGKLKVFIYTAGDERLWWVDYAVDPWSERFYIRDLDGRVLRTYGTETGHEGTWLWIEDYVYRGRLLAASVRPGEGTRYFVAVDQLGTPRMITDETGGVLALHSYLPFGYEVESIDGERMKFTGQERDPNGPGSNDDLDYAHARFFSVLEGRFLGCDRGGSRLYEPQSWNLYFYVMGNPVNLVDPTGLVTVEADPTFGTTTIYDTIWVGGGYDLSGFWRFFFGPPSGGTVHGKRRSDAFRRGAQEAYSLIQSLIPPCKPYSYGYSGDFSTINPFTSGGGGTYGFNLQYVPGEGFGFYGFSTPNGQASIGLDIGVALSANMAVGSGGWEGDFYSVMGNVQAVTAGGFAPPMGDFSIDAEGVGWYGVQIGGTVGAPYGAGATVTNYKKLIDLSGLHFWCK